MKPVELTLFVSILACGFGAPGLKSIIIFFLLELGISIDCFLSVKAVVILFKIFEVLMFVFLSFS